VLALELAFGDSGRLTEGTWLLAAVAVGLLAYGIFGILQSRYHRV
jgi:hypothetical protein